MKKTSLFISILLFALILAACGDPTAATENPVTDAADTSTAPVQTGGKIRLGEDYADAVPASTQLIIGSLQLSDDIDENLAAEILPLWQAYQALSNADTTADAELQAVVNQIQDAMNPEQIQAIAALKLTAESAQTIMQEQGIGFGRGLGAREGGAAPEGGFPGGGPGGGLPGGGPGGGGGPDGIGQLSPEARATAIAERFGGDNAGAFLERGLLLALIRNLQIKTGEIDPAQPAPDGGFAGRFVEIVAEASGVDAENLQTALADGKSFADAISENGGDMEATREALRVLFAERGLEGDELEQRVEGLLTGTQQ